jgi:hypothetical protein
LPRSFKAKESLNTSKRQIDDLPRPEDPFGTGFTWAEFKAEAIPRNPAQVKVDFTKENQIWFYLGKTSTEAKAQFTEDLALPRHNPKGHFLDTIPKPVNTAPRQSYAATYPSPLGQSSFTASKSSPRPSVPANATKEAKPYIYKPRISEDAYRIDPQAYRSQQNFLQNSTAAPYSCGTDPRFKASSVSIPSASSHSPKPASPAVSYQKYSHPTSSTSQSSSVLAPPAHFRQPYGAQVPTPPKPANFSASKLSSVKLSPFAKYKYLQKEHNKSPLDYKSPYRPGGGFMNGYQGSLERHLQQTLFHAQKSSAVSSAAGKQPASTYSSTTPYASGARGPVNPPKQAALPPQQVTKPAVQSTWNHKDNGMHPAIRQDYTAMLQQQYQSSQRPSLDLSARAPQKQMQNAQGTQPYQPTKAYQPMHPQSPQTTQAPTNSNFRNVTFPANRKENHPPSTASHQVPQPLYSHQQHFQQPQSHEKVASPTVQSHPEQTSQNSDLPDVPADSTSLIEKMMLNLRKAVTGTYPVG